MLKPAVDSVLFSSSVWLSPEASASKSGYDTREKHESPVEKFLYSLFEKEFFFPEKSQTENDPLSTKKIFNMTTGNIYIYIYH